MKPITVSAFAALCVVTGPVGLPAQAETVWHFPYKGVPYVTQSAPTVSLHRAHPRYGAYKFYRHQPCRWQTGPLLCRRPTL